MDDARFEVIEPTAPTYRQRYLVPCAACGRVCDPRDWADGFLGPGYCEGCYLDAHASVRSYGPLTESEYERRLTTALERRTR